MASGCEDAFTLFDLDDRVRDGVHHQPRAIERRDVAGGIVACQVLEEAVGDRERPAADGHERLTLAHDPVLVADEQTTDVVGARSIRADAAAARSRTLCDTVLATARAEAREVEAQYHVPRIREALARRVIVCTSTEQVEQ